MVLLVTLPLYVADQVTKWWIVCSFPPPPAGGFASSKSIPVVEDFFNIVRVHNQGIAFGIGNGTAWAPLAFLLVPVVALGVMAWFWRNGAFSNLILRLAGVLLLAGILGNLTDRLLQGFFLPHLEEAGFWTRLANGYVVDFLDFTLPLIDYRWPAFNVADSCICVAAFLLIISTFRGEEVSEDAEMSAGQ
ncbi:MAG: signal peptidase II [Akkermansiaceae bacterium]|nr:signal peptidase II [Akkermansiaceae bacterium]NNM29374.1 signal peptidase II [Akkermansiaceae bacterium]